MKNPVMRPHPVVRHAWAAARPSASRSSALVGVANRPRCAKAPMGWSTVQARWMKFSSRSRPTIAFLSSPVKTPTASRTYASERTRAWLRHEARLFVRYAIISLVGGLCVYVIHFFYLEESLEREYPTPHEWDWQVRKLLRDAHAWLNPELRPISWSQSYQLARNACMALEDLNRRGGEIPRLHDHEDPHDEISWEFIPHDVSGVSDEFRRGYFEAMMLAATGASVVDGWLKENDKSKTVVWPPQYVIGPSNPRPRPIPPNSPPAPREEDCDVAFPPADRYYLKILATKGFSPRQKMEAALEYANFIESRRRYESSEPLYNLALAEATQGMDQSKLPYNPKTLVLKNDGPPPSQNIIDAITASANHKARHGDTVGALAIYVSLLKARRSLSDTPPRPLAPPKPRQSWSQKIVALLSQPEYPPPPPDGTQPPWRSPEERCQEASLQLYIGEILFASSSHEDGVAWTREGVDEAEEQLRELNREHGPGPVAGTAGDRCRECLRTGLDNWSVMVTQLAREEKQRREKQSRPPVLSFWSSGKDDGVAEGRWDAESAVVKERTKRTSDLVEDLHPLREGFLRYLRA